MTMCASASKQTERRGKMSRNKLCEGIMVHIKHWGIDALGDEIFEDDTVLEFPNGDIVLAENIYEYVIRAFGAKELVAK
ncbi:YqaI family protein [Anoxybacillus flavithermus]|nr:hypothetical protein [Anoxybacillus flavithermus]